MNCIRTKVVPRRTRHGSGQSTGPHLHFEVWIKNYDGPKDIEEYRQGLGKSEDCFDGLYYFGYDTIVVK